jgi:hypothetical protein
LHIYSTKNQTRIKERIKKGREIGLVHFYLFVRQSLNALGAAETAARLVFFFLSFRDFYHKAYNYIVNYLIAIALCPYTFLKYANRQNIF